MIDRSWRLARVALQLLAEERIGSPARTLGREERAREDAAFDAARKALGGR